MSRLARRLQQAAAQIGGVPTLYLTPSTGTYSSGSTVTVTIREDSQAVAVNAIQANLTYATSRLEFVSISTASSAFTTTVESVGGGGEVKVAVALLGGSVTGNNIVATVTFNALSAGATAVSFAAGSAMASEADSTDVCQLQLGANYTIS